MTDPIDEAREAIEHLEWRGTPSRVLLVTYLDAYAAAIRAAEREKVRARIYKLIPHDSSMIRASDVLTALAALDEEGQ